MQEFPLRYAGLEQIYLLIAEGRVFYHPVMVQTVLGSCVSVTFHCPHKRIGAIFHALLSRAQEYKDNDWHSDPFRYVDKAVLTLWEEMERFGVKRNDVQCKVFGGANTMLDGELAVGKKNALAAFETLAQLKLRVVASHVGGDKGRKLYFFPHTGEVFMKTLIPAAGKQRA